MNRENDFPYLAGDYELHAIGRVNGKGKIHLSQHGTYVDTLRLTRRNWLIALVLLDEQLRSVQPEDAYLTRAELESRVRRRTGEVFLDGQAITRLVGRLRKAFRDSKAQKLEESEGRPDFHLRIIEMDLELGYRFSVPQDNITLRLIDKIDVPDRSLELPSS